MNSERHEVEILTPCFCAGADQAKAEIRAPSIRGQLRWWFRALGGTAAEEKAVFGGVHALKGERRNEGAKASSVVVRIDSLTDGQPWMPPRVNPNDPISYVWFFASVSGERKGMRWTKDGNVPPGSRFGLTFHFRPQFPQKLESAFHNAKEAFLRFGGLGLRTTRGLGGLQALDLAGSLEEEKAAVDRLLVPAGFEAVWVGKPFSSWGDGLAYAGALLKFLFRRMENAKRSPASPLGCSSRPRQASAVRFRIVRASPERYWLLIMEAPHDRVLEPHSRRPEFMLSRLKDEIHRFQPPSNPPRPTPGSRTRSANR